MKNYIIAKFLGKLCKILIKDSSEEKTHTITGVISDFDQDEGTIAIETNRGLFYLKVDTIISITLWVG